MAMLAVPATAAVGVGIGAFVLHRNGTIAELGRRFNLASGKTIDAFSDWMNEDELLQMRREAQKRLGMDVERDINIGICGPVKSGKSRLVNALRRVSRKDADGPGWLASIANLLRRTRPDPIEWAQEGETETTREIRPYRYPQRMGDNYCSIVLWDIPGSGTVNVPSDTYFKDNLLYAFDMLILLIKDTLREEDVRFGNLANENRVPWTFVRSRCDVDMRNDADIDWHGFIFDDSPTDSDLVAVSDFKSNLIETVRRMISENRDKFDDGRGGVEVPCFCVSAKYFETGLRQWKFEEDDLEAFIYSQVASRCKLLDVPSPVPGASHSSDQT